MSVLSFDNGRSRMETFCSETIESSPKIGAFLASLRLKLGLFIAVGHLLTSEWLGAVRFEGKNHCPVEANTSVRLLILYGVPVVNK
jgi:hypothetical protein